MKKLVIMPGGFHPWHAGHTALYQSAQTVFPSADVFVAATADTSTRPFPFKLKKMLAQAAGVPAHRFIQVKSPFRADEITQAFDPNETVLIFVERILIFVKRVLSFVDIVLIFLGCWFTDRI